jgi:hypothetical protein
MPVLQAFLAFLPAGSLFFSKITLILGKYQGDRFAADWFHHHSNSNGRGFQLDPLRI